jgi:hypothetical protein
MLNILHSWFVELRCWLLFRHSMKPLGSMPIGNSEFRAQMYQCEICAKTILVRQKDLGWI